MAAVSMGAWGEGLGGRKESPGGGLELSRCQDKEADVQITPRAQDENRGVPSTPG